MAGNVEDFTPGGVFQGSNINFTAASSSSASDATEVYIESFSLEGTTLESTYNTGGTGPSVDLSSLGGGGGGDGTNVNVISGEFQDAGYALILNLSNNTSFSIDLSDILADINERAAEDTNHFVNAVSTASDTLTLTRTDGETITASLADYNEYIPGSSDVSIDDGNGNTVTFQAGGKIRIGTTPIPTPSFAPELPDPPAAQDFSTQQTYEFDAPVNDDDDFVIDTVAVTATDQDDNNLGNVTINSDNSYDIVVPAGTEEVDVEVVVTDTEGDSVTLTEMITPYKPYWEGTTAMDGTISVGNYATALTKHEEDFPIGESFNITPHGSNTTGRVRYWVVARFNMTFTSGGLPFTPDSDPTTFTLAGETYYIYDMGIAGNPFDSSAAAPTQTFVSTEV